MATRELYDHILAFRFDLAEERCRNHPHDLEFRCPRGYSPLHRLVCHRGVATVAIAAQANGGAGGGQRRGDPILRTVRAMLRAADEIGFEGAEGVLHPLGDEVVGAVRLASDRGNRAMWSPLHLLCQLGAGYGEDGAEDLVRCLLLLDEDDDRNGDKEDGRDDIIEQDKLHEQRLRRARHLASLRDRQGRTALHLLCERRIPPDDGIVDVLLSLDPSLALCRDRRGDTSLSHLVRLGDNGLVAHHFLRRFLSASEEALRGDREVGSGGFASRNSEKENVNRDSNFILPLACGPCSRRNLIHSAVRIPALFCPPVLVVRLVANEHSKFVREWDEDENLPIHVFAACGNIGVTKTCSITAKVESSLGTSYSTNTDLSLSYQQKTRSDPYKPKGSPSRAAVERGNAFAALLRSFPESAAMRNSTGMLPLQLASAAGTSWTGGVARLIGAYPQALAAMDVDMRLYPRILALAGRKVARSGFPTESERRGLDLMFELVKAKPDLVECWSVEGASFSSKEGKKSNIMIKSVWGKRFRVWDGIGCTLARLDAESVG